MGDRLIWEGNNKGRYTTKDGCRELVQANSVPVQYLQNKKDAWGRIWSCRCVIPRVQVFLWRAVHGALAVSDELHKRISQINLICQRCEQENENIMHMLFFCPMARATWYASQFSLRVDGLPLDFNDTLLELTTNMEDEQITWFCNALWNLWKARNQELYAGKRGRP